VGYCTVCGSKLDNWKCPNGHRVDARPRLWRAAWGRKILVASGVVLILAAIAVPYALLQDGLSALRDDVGKLRVASLTDREQATLDRATLSGLSERLTALEAATESEKNPGEIARRAIRSVVTVVSGNFPNESQGSGFALRATASSSLIVTNYHVVQNTWELGGRAVSVKQDAGTFPATIEAVNSAYDLAVVRVSVSFPVLPAASQRPRAGDSVLVIGSPFGLEGSVSTGVASGMRFGYLQFSAPISPGSSGGPVLNMEGDVVGVAVMKVVAGGAEGLSFAVPIRDVCERLVGC
jgi:putative serine protease PepD